MKRGPKLTGVGDYLGARAEEPCFAISPELAAHVAKRTA